MTKSNIFRIFCFLTAILVFIHVLKDFAQPNVSYLSIFMQLGFMVVLIDIGVHAKAMKYLSTKAQETSSHNYHFLASKFGISTMCISLIAQSFMV